MADFNYTPLHPNSYEIRFINLQPGAWDAKIQCSIHHDFLDKHPSYEALSYTWGDPHLTRSIGLNGCQFQVTANLEIALRYLRREGEARALWVDAICIDQSNLKERSEQVKRMRDIYTFAAKVIAWTGEADSDSDEAIVLIKEIGRILSIKESEQSLPMLNVTLKYFQELGFDLSTKNWTAVWRFCSRPYWSRMWVIQELFYSGPIFEPTKDRCTILCGSSELSKAELGATFLLLSAVKSSNVSFLSDGTRIGEPARAILIEGSPAAMQMCEALLLYGFNESFQLTAMDVVDLMSTTKAFQASDCRDKLYALLALFDEKDTEIVADYSKSPEKVYTDLVQVLVDHDRNLKSLKGNRFGINSFGPSWIPELYGRQTVVTAWGKLAHFRASARVEARVSFDLTSTLFLTSTLLHARGILLGSVDFVIGPFTDPKGTITPDTGHTPDVFAVLQRKGSFDQFEALRRFSQTLDENKHEIFWRTLLMDGDYRNADKIILPAPDEFELMYKVLFGLAIVPETFEPYLPAADRINLYGLPFGLNEQCLVDRCFFTMGCGRMGIGPYRSNVGDVVVILYGGDRPFLLRPKGEQYELIGDAYVHGVSRGELFDGIAEEKMLETQIFTLC